MRVMTPDEHKLQYQRLQKLTHGNMMKLIDSELKLALTMSALAQTEAGRGDRPHAIRLLEKVEQAVGTVRHLMAYRQVSDDERRGIEDRMREVTKALQAARQSVSEASPKRANPA